MYNISPIGRKTISPYGGVSKTQNVGEVNPFFQEDSFSISDDAMILSAALSEAKSAIVTETNKLDLNRINELKQQIQSGEYKVSGRDVADRIMF